MIFFANVTKKKTGIILIYSYPMANVVLAVVILRGCILIFSSSPKNMFLLILEREERRESEREKHQSDGSNPQPRYAS